MTSYLFISTDKEKLQGKIEARLTEHHVDQFDTNVLELANFETAKSAKKSWGIDDVKQLQKKIVLKPFAGTWKATILWDADALTPEAQNALLKLLEEPPANTLIILTAASQESILPTIISRCFVFEIPETADYSDDLKHEIFLYFQASPSLSERLKRAESLSKNKYDALKWISQTMNILHTQLLEKETDLTLRRLQSLQKTYLIIKSTNTNLRLTLEHLFLNLE